MNITFDYDKFDKRGLTKLVKQFEKEALPVAEVSGDNKPTRLNGFQTKTAVITFESGQKLEIKAKLDGGIFSWKLNNKILAIKNYMQLDQAMKEVVSYVKENEPNYQKQKERQLAKVKVAVPAIKPVNTTVAEQTAAFQTNLEELTGQNEALNSQIAEASVQVSTKQADLDTLNTQIATENERTKVLEGLLENAKQGIFESASSSPMSFKDFIKFLKDQIKSEKDVALDVLIKSVEEAWRNGEPAFIDRRVDLKGKRKEFDRLNKLIKPGIFESASGKELSVGTKVKVLGRKHEGDAEFSGKTGVITGTGIVAGEPDKFTYSVKIDGEVHTQISPDMVVKKGIFGSVFESSDAVVSACPECGAAMEQDDAGCWQCPACGCTPGSLCSACGAHLDTNEESSTGFQCSNCERECQSDGTAIMEAATMSGGMMCGLCLTTMEQCDDGFKCPECGQTSSTDGTVLESGCKKKNKEDGEGE